MMAPDAFWFNFMFQINVFTLWNNDSYQHVKNLILNYLVSK